jgi:hypothetical protein
MREANAVLFRSEAARGSVRTVAPEAPTFLLDDLAEETEVLPLLGIAPA